jgi:hypothetical protein
MVRFQVVQIMQSATSRVRIAQIMQFRYIGLWISLYIRRRLTKIAHRVTMRNLFYVRQTFVVAVQPAARGQPGRVLPTIPRAAAWERCGAVERLSRPRRQARVVLGAVALHQRDHPAADTPYCGSTPLSVVAGL